MAAFSGVASFDGANATVEGSADIRADAAIVGRLSQLAMKGGGFEGLLQGLPEQRYILEVSSDLVNWTELSTVTTDGTGRVQFRDSQAAQFSSRYYRARPVAKPTTPE